MRRKHAIRLLTAAGAGLLLPRSGGATLGPSRSPSGVPGETAARDAVPGPADMSWWREARFGLFIHWGPVSLAGTEIGWSRGAEVPVEEYDALHSRFNPTAFDAGAWARLAKDAGAGYVVLTTKHHDGFCLWDTPRPNTTSRARPSGGT